MSVIWKFGLKPNEGDSMIATIAMPSGAQVLTVQVQAGIPQIWAVVDPKAPIVERRFQVVGTGHPFEMKPSHKYLGTFQMHQGLFVYHLFEVI
jgi:hypothetical protein